MYIRGCRPQLPQAQVAGRPPAGHGPAPQEPPHEETAGRVAKNPVICMLISPFIYDFRVCSTKYMYSGNAKGNPEWPQPKVHIPHYAYAV